MPIPWAESPVPSDTKQQHALRENSEPDSGVSFLLVIAQHGLNSMSGSSPGLHIPSQLLL
jgi:hypothetical protein